MLLLLRDVFLIKYICTRILSYNVIQRGARQIIPNVCDTVRYEASTKLQCDILHELNPEYDHECEFRRRLSVKETYDANAENCW